MGTPNPTPTLLDQNQIFQRAFDEANDRLRVDTAATIINGAMEVAIDATTDNIQIKDPNNGNGLVINNDGSINVILESSSIEIGTVDQGTPNSLANAWPVKPTDGTNEQSYTAAGEAKVLVTPLTNSSIIKVQLQDNSGTAITLGQKVLVSSIPVAIASNQTAIPVSQSGTWNINNISGTISLPTGASTEVTLSNLNNKFVDGTDIGDVTINNTSGAAAVNIQDGGNSITIDGTIAASQSGTWDISSNSSFKTGTDTFITTGNGITIDTSVSPLKSFSIQVDITGTVSVWDVRLEGSLDNINFTQILQHTNSTGDGITIYSGSILSPSLYFRARCAGFTGLGGASLTSIILGIQ